MKNAAQMRGTTLRDESRNYHIARAFDDFVIEFRHAASLLLGMCKLAVPFLMCSELYGVLKAVASFQPSMVDDF